MPRHVYDRLRKIATPKEGMAKCGTRAQYAARHAEQMANMRSDLPALDIQEPFLSSEHPQPFVAGGKWIVLCECGDAPMASPDWDEARCFNCGAIYRGLPWPEDRAGVEAALIARPFAAMRAWLPKETVSDLIAQNIAHGVPSPQDPK